MSNVTIGSYLFFENGTCREAMEFYKGVFGGEVSYTTFDSMPGTQPEHADKIMHADLHGGDIGLFGSDVFEKQLGTGKIELCLGGEDEARLTEIFDALSQGGTVRSALKKEAWGDTFGQLTDKYNVAWMVNIRTAQA
ncbi:MAG TPA: VOC family protein [Candidatus Saccharimonadales bacterium]